jgi:septum formation inhibitor-activating ATPase MinD
MIICIANQKGEVAKCTAAINLSAGLAWEANDVLLVGSGAVGLQHKKSLRQREGSFGIMPRGF